MQLIFWSQSCGSESDLSFESLSSLSVVSLLLFVDLVLFILVLFLFYYYFILFYIKKNFFFDFFLVFFLYLFIVFSQVRILFIYFRSKGRMLVSESCLLRYFLSCKFHIILLYFLFYLFINLNLNLTHYFLDHCLYRHFCVVCIHMLDSLRGCINGRMFEWIFDAIFVSFGFYYYLFCSFLEKKQTWTNKFWKFIKLKKFQKFESQW